MGLFDVDTPDPPRPRSLLGEGEATIAAQTALAPSVFGLENQYADEYALLGASALGSSLLGGTPAPTRRITGYTVSPLRGDEAQYHLSFRQRGWGDEITPEQYERGVKLAPGRFENWYHPVYEDVPPPEGPGGGPARVPGVAEVAAAASGLQRASDISDLVRLGPSAVQAVRGLDPDQHRLVQGLQRRAADDLSRGGEADPWELRQADEDIAGAYAARGRNRSNEAITSTVLNRYGLRNRRLRERQAAAGQAAGVGAQTGVDPALAVLGRPSTGAGLAAATLQRGPATGLADPFSAYAADLYNTNYNAQAASNIAGSNADAAGMAAGTGFLGSAATAFGTVKAAMLCLDGRCKIDTPVAPLRADQVRPGDTVTGFSGMPATVLQVHQYLEREDDAEKFRRVVLANGREILLCRNHRIMDLLPDTWASRFAAPTREDLVSLGQANAGAPQLPAEVHRYAGPAVTYDILTDDPMGEGGYRCGGVPVNSMITALAEKAAELAASAAFA